MELVLSVVGLQRALHAALVDLHRFQHHRACLVALATSLKRVQDLVSLVVLQQHALLACLGSFRRIQPCHVHFVRLDFTQAQLGKVAASHALLGLRLTHVLEAAVARVPCVRQAHTVQIRLSHVLPVQTVTL